MKYQVTHTTKYTYTEAVPVCHNIVHLQPRALPYQTARDFRLVIQPEPPTVTHCEDYFGNRAAYFAIDQAHHGLTVTAASRIERNEPGYPPAEQTVAWDALHARLRAERTPEILDAYQFVAPSPQVRPFDELGDYARESFAPNRPVLECVEELTHRIHEEFTYDPRATTVNTPIADVFRKRHGVCQDFAHVQIGCLRALGLAARYVSGYLRTYPPPGKPRLVGADASHAWLSVFCGDAGWVDVDPTNDVLAATDHITVAWGRDYNDVCPIQGVIVGGGEHQMDVSVDVAPLEEEEAAA